MITEATVTAAAMPTVRTMTATLASVNNCLQESREKVSPMTPLNVSRAKKLCASRAPRLPP